MARIEGPAADAAPPNRLRELRDTAGLPRHRVAAVVDRDPMTLRAWELRERPIPDWAKEKLAAYFGVSIAWLMAWEIPTVLPTPPNTDTEQEAA